MPKVAHSLGHALPSAFLTEQALTPAPSVQGHTSGQQRPTGAHWLNPKVHQVIISGQLGSGTGHIHNVHPRTWTPLCWVAWGHLDPGGIISERPILSVMKGTMAGHLSTLVRELMPPGNVYAPTAFSRLCGTFPPSRHRP